MGYNHFQKLDHMKIKIRYLPSCCSFPFNFGIWFNTCPYYRNIKIKWEREKQNNSDKNDCCEIGNRTSFWRNHSIKLFYDKYTSHVWMLNFLNCLRIRSFKLSIIQWTIFSLFNSWSRFNSHILILLFKTLSTLKIWIHH